MIKIALCDDDLSALDEITGLFDKYRLKREQEMTYATFHSPLELLAEIEKGRRWDVLFLDIIMPGQNGISVAKEIRQYDKNVKIIFFDVFFGVCCGILCGGRIFLSAKTDRRGEKLLSAGGYGHL